MPARIIVFGNEKGGSGKSTTAMHVTVSLLQDGWRVGVIDLDGRQKTLARYIENRRGFAARNNVVLPLPECRVVTLSLEPTRELSEADERARFEDALGSLMETQDFVVVDCPGNDSFLARLGHSFADILITPLNDSFVDLDLLAEVHPETYAVVRPSHYSVMVWEQRKNRFARDRSTVDWVVTRNRLSQLDAKNKQRVGRVLEKLAGRIGFRLAPGVGERVIYREMFLSGLTLLDLQDPKSGIEMTMSHVAARQEIRALMASLRLPEVGQQAAAV